MATEPCERTEHSRLLPAPPPELLAGTMARHATHCRLDLAKNPRMLPALADDEDDDVAARRKVGRNRSSASDSGMTRDSRRTIGMRTCHVLSGGLAVYGQPALSSPINGLRLQLVVQRLGLFPRADPQQLKMLVFLPHTNP